MALAAVNRQARPPAVRCRMSEGARRALAALVWGGTPLLLAWLSPVPGWLPALGVLRGPLGVVWGGLTLAVAVAGFFEGRHTLRWEPRPCTLLALTAVVYLAIGLRYATRLQPSGDEPHYLLMAQSLWREADLDLRDNLARGDYLEYTPGPLEPHYGAPRPDGRPFPAHGVLLPLLLAPVYALGGRTLCVALMALAAAALALEALRLGQRVTGNRRAALWGWAAAAGPPLVFYAFHLYTEVPSGLAMAVALRMVLSAPGPAGAALAALLAGALPWLHLKMIPTAAALGLIAVLLLRGRSRFAFLATAVLIAAGFFAYYRWIFGVPSPLAIYGGRLPAGESGPPLTAALGLLLDRSFGLAPYALVFLLAMAALPPLVRQARALWPFGLIALAVLAPVLVWRMWWGGQCPPGRFLVPLVPLLGLAVSVRLARPAVGLVRWRGVLVAIGAALALFMVARPAELLLLNRGARPTRVWAALSGDVPVARYLPSLVSGEASEWRVALVWLVALGTLLALDALAHRRAMADRLFRGLALPVLLGLGVGLAIDLWARAAVG
jgi:hypothetical protein